MGCGHVEAFTFDSTEIAGVMIRRRGGAAQATEGNDSAPDAARGGIAADPAHEREIPSPRLSSLST
jgi:hypothetical protein